MRRTKPGAFPKVKEPRKDEVRIGSRGQYVIGLLYAVTGAALLLAFLVAVAGAILMSMGVVPATFLLIALGVLLLVSGVGLLGRRVWAWYLGLLTSLSGLAAIGFRLLLGAEPLPLVPPLVTDLLVTIALLRLRPRTSGFRPAR